MRQRTQCVNALRGHLLGIGNPRRSAAGVSSDFHGAKGSIIARDWAVGFALGIGLRSKEWEQCILLHHCRVLGPILVYCEGELDLLPDMPAAEKRQRQTTAHAEIAQAVAAVRNICNPYRAVEARQPAKPHRAGRTRR